MSDNPRGTNPFDPTDERTADQATERGSGLTSGRRDPAGAAAEEDCPGPQDTPRRYEQPADADDPGSAPGRD